MSRIVHLALKVEDLRDHVSRHLTDGAIDFTLIKYDAEGCQIISAPGEIPMKFRAPGGTVAELVPVGRYRNSASR
jgi:lactoylglutathione lyase